MWIDGILAILHFEGHFTIYIFMVMVQNFRVARLDLDLLSLLIGFSVLLFLTSDPDLSVISDKLYNLKHIQGDFLMDF